MARARDGRFLLVAAIAAQLLAMWFVHWIDTRGYMDTEIYQLGARAWLSGWDVYGGDLTPESPDSSTLPFIYPPIAAVLFTPLYWLSGTGAVLAVSALSHLSILVTAYALARSSEHLAHRSGQVALVTAAALPVLTLIEPTRETINYGQINLVLMALVAADCLLPRTRWPRGLLVGIAAAIKLTPLGFLLLFLLRKDFRALTVSAATFAGSVLIGFLVAPSDSVTWWFDEMLSTGDSMGTVYAGNLTLRALLAKQELTGAWLNVPWALGAVLLLVLAVFGMRYALRRANTPLALMFNAALVVLISPISWSHHWVWAGPALVVLFGMALRNRWYGVQMALAFFAAALLAGPHWYLPNTDDRELDWTFSQQIVGNIYTLFGIAFLVAGAVAYCRFRPPRTATVRHRSRSVPAGPTRADG